MRMRLMGVTLALLGTASANASEQPDAKRKFVPAGWTVEKEIPGDLSGDGVPDAVLMLVEDGHRNPTDEAGRTLVVLAGRRDGSFEQIGMSKKLLLCLQCFGAMDGGPALSIQRGVLIVDQLTGSRETASGVWRFRFDPGSKRMRMIGLDVRKTDRATGVSTFDSTNYLNGKRITESLRYDKTKGQGRRRRQEGRFGRYGSHLPGRCRCRSAGVMKVSRVHVERGGRCVSGGRVRVAAVVALLVAVPPRATASSSSGLEISVGKFTLRVTYVDVLQYGDQADRAIQDPRQVLFTVGSLVQANAAALAKIDAAVWAEIGRNRDEPSTQLRVSYDVAATGDHVVLRDGASRKDIEQDVVNTLCSAFPAGCAVKPSPVLELYECPGTSRCAGLVQFGPLPSPDMPKRLALLAPTAGRGSRIRVERRHMARYFPDLK